MSAARRSRSKSSTRPESAPGARPAAPDEPAIHGIDRGNWLALAVLSLVAVACYANALSNPFVFDDLEAIVRNPQVKSLSPLSEAFSAPPQSAVAGRPMVAFSLALNYAWGQLSPWGYHLFNIGVHAACGMLLFLIVRRALNLWNLEPVEPSNQNLSNQNLSNQNLSNQNPSNQNHRNPGNPWNLWNPSVIAFVVSLLWLVHPLQTELIDYVVQRSESMTALCYFGALYASLIVMTEPERATKWTGIAVASCAIGMACKEVMVTAPIMILAFDVIFVSGSIGRAVRERRALYLGLAATWIVLWLLIAGGPRWRSAGFQSGISSWTYLLSQGQMILTYLKLTVWPHPLILDYGMTQPVAWSAAAPYAVVVFALVLLTVYALWRWPAAGFLGAWFFVTLSPSSSIVPIVTELGAERRMYLPLAALITLVVVLGARAMEKYAGAGSTRVRAIAGGTVALIVVLLAFVTVQRNRDYRDLITLWRHVLEVRPHGRAHYSLAIELKNAGRVDEAIEEYKRSAVDFPDAHYALGYEYRDAGKLESAVDEFRKFVMAAPLDGEAPKAFVMLGTTLSTAKRYDESVEAFRTALRMRPKDLDARAGLADALVALGKHEEAVQAYGAYLQLAPKAAGAYGNLGRALVALGRSDEASRAFGLAVELTPDDTKARLNYGYSLAALAKLDEAGEQARVVLARVPHDVDALDLLGIVLAAQGHREEAAARFEEALRLDPGNPQIRADYETALGVKR